MKNTYKNSYTYRKTYKKMQNMRRGNKPGFPRLAIAAIFCAAALVAVFLAVKFLGYKDEDHIQVDNIAGFETSSQIPYIAMKTDAGTVFNRLSASRGGDFTNTKAGNSLVPLPNDRNQKIKISISRDDIRSISYQIRDLNTGDLIEESQVADLESEGDETEGICRIKNLISPQKEYKMQIKLETDKYPPLLYNTRLKSMGDVWLEQKLEFVKTFTRNIYDPSKEEEIYSNIFAQTVTDASNYASANYNSLAANIMWSKLSPKLDQAVIPTVVRVDNKSTKITESYPIIITDEGKARRVIVNEVYSVRMNADDRVSLVNYQRKAYQTLENNELKITRTGLGLGFNADSDVDVSSSADGHFAAFINGGNIWSVCDGKGDAGSGSDRPKITRVFSFDTARHPGEDITSSIETTEDGGIKSMSHDYKLDIMSVGNNGDLVLVAYGMFPTGIHMGCQGVGVYKYTEADKTLNELVFIPIEADMDTLGNIVKNSYLNKDGNYFLINNGKLTKVDTRRLKASVEPHEIVDNMFAFSQDRSHIAYLSKKGENENLAGEIILYDFNTGDSKVISAPEGKSMQLIGYVGEDLVTAVTDKANGGYADSIAIFDKDGNEIKKYEESGRYLGYIAINGISIDFNIYAKGADNSFVKERNNQLLGKAQTVTDNVSATFIRDPLVGKRLWIVFAAGAKASDNPEVTVINDYKYAEEDTVGLP